MWNQRFNPLFPLPVKPGYLGWCFAGRGEDRTEGPAALTDGSSPLLEAPLPLGRDGGRGQVTTRVHRLL